MELLPVRYHQFQILFWRCIAGSFRSHPLVGDAKIPKQNPVGVVPLDNSDLVLRKLRVNCAYVPSLDLAVVAAEVEQMV